MYVPAPHTAKVLAEIIIEHFFEWNLDRTVFTITVDKCSTNDALILKFSSLDVVHLFWEGLTSICGVVPIF